MKNFKQLAYSLTVILLLNQIANWLLVHKNDGKKYIDQYITTSKEIKLHVKDENFEEQFGHTSYMKYTVFFKAIFGGSQDYTFRDSYSGKYFKIMRFDKYGDEFRHPQTYEINDQDMWATVDKMQYNNPAFGTLQTPILIFKYKGINRIFTSDRRTDKKGENGRYIYITVPLAPSEEEYRYSVENYLTYIMSKKEFNERFKGK